MSAVARHPRRAALRRARPPPAARRPRGRARPRRSRSRSLAVAVVVALAPRRARPRRAPSASRSAPRSTPACRRAATRPACGGSAAAGPPWTAARAGGRIRIDAPNHRLAARHGASTRSFALPGSMPAHHDADRVARLDLDAAGAEHQPRVPASPRGGRPALEGRRAPGPARARRSRFDAPGGHPGAARSRPGARRVNGPGWCNWPAHLLELRGADARARGVRRARRHGRGRCSRRGARSRRRAARGPRRPTATPASAGSRSRSAASPVGTLEPAALPRRPPAAVPAGAARHARRRHPRGGRRPASPAGRGDRRARATPARWIPATVAGAQPAAGRHAGRRRPPARRPRWSSRRGAAAARPRLPARPRAPFPPNPLAGRGHVRNGTHASERARIRAWLEPAGRRRSRAARRCRPASACASAGVLTDPRGRPIGRATLAAVRREPGGAWKAVTGVRTRPNGRFTAFSRIGPSQELRFVYYAYGDSRARPQQPRARVRGDAPCCGSDRGRPRLNGRRDRPPGTAARPVSHRRPRALRRGRRARHARARRGGRRHRQRARARRRRSSGSRRPASRSTPASTASRSWRASARWSRAPACPRQAPVIATALERGIEVIGEVELGWRLLPDTEFVAVTGSNGKTTTVELIGHIHREAGLPVIVAGNVGTALTSLPGTLAPGTTVVCEVSSFQLEDADRLRARRRGAAQPRRGPPGPPRHLRGLRRRQAARCSRASPTRRSRSRRSASASRTSAAAPAASASARGRGPSSPSAPGAVVGRAAAAGRRRDPPARRAQPPERDGRRRRLPRARRRPPTPSTRACAPSAASPTASRRSRPSTACSTSTTPRPPTSPPRWSASTRSRAAST